MDRRSLPLNALRAFEAVARHGSFTAAASALFISQSALSRHVLALEAQIGSQLFERRHHALVLTEAGQLLLPAVKKSFDRLELALADIGRDGEPVRQVLRVQMPPSFATHLAVPILRDFRKDFPDLMMDIVSPSSGVGATEVDVSVVYSRPMVTDAVTDLLWQERPTILCHPAVAERLKGRDLATAIAENELIHVRIAGQPRHYVWTELVRQAGLGNLDVERGLVFDTANLAAQYALSGEGLALIDPLLFADDIRSSKLARPFDIAVDPGFAYYLTTQPDDLGDVAISTFRSWLILRFGAGTNPLRRNNILPITSIASV